MYKYSVLQYNFNNYDIYREPKILDPNCEYILVTDNSSIKSDKIKIILDESLNKLPIWEKCYSVRFNLFKYATTPVCIYLDANVQINISLNELYENFIQSSADLGLLLHPKRSNIIHEYFAWCKTRNYPMDRAVYILNYLLANGYNIKCKGLYEGKMRICKNTELNNKIDNMCFTMLKELSYNNDVERIDQTIYSIILNQKFNNINIFPIFPKYLYNINNFNVYLHNTNNKAICGKMFPYYYLFDKKLNAD